MFSDQVKIYVQAGKGGDGSVAFRREKYIPFGGPSGGDGGRGGNVVLVVNRHLNTLYHFRHHKEFKAQNGVNGRNKDRHGANGDDLQIPVPQGTLVLDAQSGSVLADLVEVGQAFVVAHGGRGGRGNARFATATHQAPRIAERGDPGEQRWIKLDLKLLADVGLVGKPNAGKSTLLSVTTAAKPEIASYPFTTLQPNLGVVALSDSHTFVMADLPGLIEGASLGKGLGYEFLRHIERTRLILHLVDGEALDPLEDFEAINTELAEFGHGLIDKPQIIAINKLDIPGVRDILPDLREEFRERGYEQIYAISALTRENVRRLMGALYQALQNAPPPPIYVSTTATFIPQWESDAFTVEREADHVWRVRGSKIERAVQRTPTQWYDALLRLHSYLERQGVLSALREAGVQEGDTIHIADYELEWRESGFTS